MRAVWKFELDYERGAWRTFEIPAGARLVHCAAMPAGAGLRARNVAALWFEVDTTSPLESRTFEVFGTGWVIPAGEYVGTVIDLPLVLHVYELETGAAVAE